MTIDPLAHFLSSIPPRLTREEERSLSERYHAGDIEAGKTLVATCLPFAIRYAKRRLDPEGQDLDDLIGAACLGLCEALARYKPGKGAAFTTYSSFYIMHEVTEAVSRDYPVKYGTSRSGADRRIMNGLTRSQDKLSKKLGREPTMAEVAEDLEVDEERLRAHIASRSVARLDAPVRAEGSTPLVELMSVFGRCQEQEAIASEIKVILEAFAATLDSVDLKIWHLRLVADVPATLADLGQNLGTSPQSISAREGRILKRLKKHLIAKEYDL